MQIQRAKLLDSLRLVLSGCGDEQQFDAAVFHNGWVSSYNDTISVSAGVEDLKDLNAMVKVKELQKLVQKLRGDLIEITDDTDKIILECGNTRAELAKFPDTVSQCIDSLQLDKIEWTELPKDFASMLALCRLENHKTKMPIVHFDGTDVLADEGVRANFGTLSAAMPKFSLHTAVAKELLAMGTLSSYTLQGTWFHVFTAAGAVFSCKVHTEAYPSKQRLSMKKQIQDLDPVFSMPVPAGLSDAVDRVETFAVAAPGTGALSLQVHITQEALFLKTSKEAGNVSERIFWDTPLPEGTDISFEASVPYLREASKRVQEFSVVQFPTNPKVEGLPPEKWPAVYSPRLTFTGENFLQLVMVVSK